MILAQIIAVIHNQLHDHEGHYTKFHQGNSKVELVKVAISYITQRNYELDVDLCTQAVVDVQFLHTELLHNVKGCIRDQKLRTSQKYMAYNHHLKHKYLHYTGTHYYVIILARSQLSTEGSCMKMQEFEASEVICEIIVKLEKQGGDENEVVDISQNGNTNVPSVNDNQLG